MSKSNYISSLVIASMLIGCNDDVNSAKPVVENGTKSYLISADSVNNIPVSQLKSFASMTGQPAITALVKYGVTTYRVVYTTTFQGKPIEASGLLYVPQGLGEAAPLVSLQHGTTFTKKDAPSVVGHYTGMEYFAAAGYIAAMPDYIGYGSSSALFHPYYDREHSALAVIDMIKSSKEFLESKSIAVTDQLFLAGYSEGGYVTLAAAKELETNPAHNLTVTAVAAGAGGYDLDHMLSRITGSSYYSYPSYLAFVLMSYNNTYNWNRPLDDFFQSKYVPALNTYMNGEYGGWTINSKLTTDVRSLLNRDFLTRLQSNSGEVELKKALHDNSVSGWKTQLPMRLYHGTKDEIIPYENSEKALENFKAFGSDNVSLKLIPGGTHGSSFIPMIQDFVPWFQQLRK